MSTLIRLSHFFFFNQTSTTDIYTLSLHDALPIWQLGAQHKVLWEGRVGLVDTKANHETVEVERRGNSVLVNGVHDVEDRKSTRLNSSHGYISYAVFCLKKKKKNI